jgi:hypothetical protein
VTKRHPAALVPVALVAIAVLLAGCSADPSRSTVKPTPSTSPTPTGPIDMQGISAGTALKPATYAMPLLYNPDDPVRAVVEIPDGYFSSGGWNVDDGHGQLAPDEYGNLSFWGAIDQFDPDPCKAGPHVHIGTSVGDLADALVAQRHRTTSTPVRVTLGGYEGLYLEGTGPAHPSRCRGGTATIFAVDPVDPFWLQDEIPGTIDKLWILDVQGRRVVASVQIMPGHTSNPDELVGIAQSVKFTGL